VAEPSIVVAANGVGLNNKSDGGDLSSAAVPDNSYIIGGSDNCT
jgi:hypothetical protein